MDVGLLSGNHVDDVTAECDHRLNFHDIDENVLKLDVLGHDPTMIQKLQDLLT